MAKKGTTMDPKDLHTRGSNTAVTLLSGIETIESLEGEKAEVAERIKAEKSALKSMGLDMRVVQAVLKRRRQNREEVEELDSLVDTYEAALEKAAMERGD